ncbi:MAG TPA: lectin-like protein [Anaerolineales bacterium]|nr:lectin-like protein [Anaerolineales bacterium]
MSTISRDRWRRILAGSLALGLIVALTFSHAAITRAQDTPATLTWITNPANNHAYAVLTGCASWHACEAGAVAEGGHLVAVNNADEQAWLVDTFDGTTLYWIGFTDEAQATVWVWTTGEAVTYTNWYPGEPSNSAGTEHYALMNWTVPGQWNDGHALAAINLGIVERTSAPPTSTAEASETLTRTATLTTTPPTATPVLPLRLYLPALWRQDLGYLPGG